MAGCFSFTQDFQDQQMQLLKEQRKKAEASCIALIGRATRVRQMGPAKIQ
jgi:hypothetical protein